MLRRTPSADPTATTRTTDATVATETGTIAVSTPGAPERRPRSSRRAVAVGAQVLVLTLVTGASTAFAVLHTTVTVDVDGAPVEVTAFGRTVGDVLADAGIEAGPRDLVAPALDAPAPDGGEIVVRHGREVEVEVDGEARTVWTTALTVGEAMGDLGVRGEGARVSASRSSALGRGDLLRVSTRKTVHVVVDGEARPVVTAAPTVRETLQDAGLVLGEGDHVSVPLDATAVDGLVVLVTRAVVTSETVVEELPFTETVVEDPTLLEGQRRVQTAGRAGQRQVTSAVTTVGGVEVARAVVTEMVVSEPVGHVVRLGTRPAPVVAAPAAPAPSSGGGSAPSGGSAPAAPISVDPGSAQGIARELAAARGWGDDEFSCLVQLWTKESGWRVNAENRSSGAYGIPQALPGSKMASVGDDWRTNPATQITWGLNYIGGRYGTPCGAWSSFLGKGWYCPTDV